MIWERRRDITKPNPEWENRHFVASSSTEERTPQEFYRSIRDHWGIESRLHWRKDAVLYEDKTRCRTPWVISNLMLLRNLVIHAYEHTHRQGDPMPAWLHKNQRDTRTQCRRMMRVKWSK